MAGDGEAENGCRQADRAPEPEQPSGGDDPLSDVLLAWALALGLVYAVFLLAPEAEAWVAAALVWVGVTLAFAWWRGLPLAALGLTLRRPLRALGWAVAACALVLPPFALAFLWYFGAEGWIPAPPVMLVGLFLFHLAMAGIPEEVFFRGLVQERLGATRWGRRRVRGLGRLWAVLAASALFAVTHIAFVADPLSAHGAARLLTFFPGVLFGLLREWTGGVWAPAIFHSACNAWLAWLEMGYL